MRVAIMQPYFFPYIGYFQLLASVDLFVVYDNIKYTKKGWINRNRFLRSGVDAVFSLPLKADSDYLDIRDRSLAADFSPDKLLNQFRGAYARAPQFAHTFPMLERAIRCDERNLFAYLRQALATTRDHLCVSTEIRTSSTIPIDHSLKGQDKVIALARAVGATTYINPIGGTELYSKEAFSRRGLQLFFLRPMPLQYRQFDDAFVPWLSIIDVLMFNDADVVSHQFLRQFELL